MNVFQFAPNGAAPFDPADLLVYSRLLDTGEQDSVFAWLRARFAHY